MPDLWSAEWDSMFPGTGEPVVSDVPPSADQAEVDRIVERMEAGQDEWANEVDNWVAGHSRPTPQPNQPQPLPRGGGPPKPTLDVTQPRQPQPLPGAAPPVAPGVQSISEISDQIQMLYVIILLMLMFSGKL